MNDAINPYQSKPFSHARARDDSLLFRASMSASYASIAFVISTLIYVYWLYLTRQRDVVAPRLIPDAIGIGIGFAALAGGASILTSRTAKSKVVFPFSVSAMCLCGAAVVCSILMSIFDLHPRTYADNRSEFFRPIVTSIIFVVILAIVSYIFSSKKTD